MDDIMDIPARRLFILRPDNLGDLVLFTGALRHIRRKWRGAKITLCVRAYAIGLFTHCPYVDKLLVYETFYDKLAGEGRLKWMPCIRGADRIGNWIRPILSSITRLFYATDTVLLPLLSPCSDYHQVIRTILAREKIGICGNTANQSLECDRNSRSWYSTQMDATGLPDNYPELEATRSFLQYLGIPVELQEIRPEFWTTNNDRQKMEAWFSRLPNEIVIGIVPGNTNVMKNLPPMWFDKVLSGLRKTKFKFILLGSAADVSICAAIRDLLREHENEHEVLNIAGKTSISELVECIKLCDVLLCQDSATLHVATGLHKPVVGIMGGGHFGRFYPWGDPHLSKVVNKKMDCYGCNWLCQFDTVRCIQEISPEAATAELNALINDLTV